jgi:lysyl-tRNA synthetase class 2
MESGDNWRPAATIEMLQRRAGLLRAIRDFFHHSGVMEVETPICSRYATTDPAIESLETLYTGPGAASGQQLYLHTSPEFPMKRLLAAGSGPVYQIARVFRDGESGRFHNPEFTMLEWYRPGFSHHQLMQEVSELVQQVCGGQLETEMITYQQAFERSLGLNPHQATSSQLRQCAINNRIPGADSIDLGGKDAWLDLLMSSCVEQSLPRDRLCFIYDYPASQASLARVRRGDPEVAERFELYIDGMEIANGFHELANPDEQQARFQTDREKRKARGQRVLPLDENLIAALEQGLPQCSGVALGIDRLLMWLTGAEHIDEVLAFPLGRA